jgi:hypothetical protein
LADTGGGVATLAAALLDSSGILAMIATASCESNSTCTLLIPSLGNAKPDVAGVAADLGRLIEEQ